MRPSLAHGDLSCTQAGPDGDWHTSLVAVVRWPVDRLVAEIDVLGGRSLTRTQYFREVADRLRRVVDSDATCWHTLDPETRLLTSDSPQELIDYGVYTAETAPAAGALIVASEYLRPDVNTFASLAGRRTPVGILSEATRGRPERSARYRDPARPLGDPARAARRLRHPRPLLRGRPHRAPRRQARLHARGRGRARTGRRHDR